MPKLRYKHNGQWHELLTGHTIPPAQSPTGFNSEASFVTGISESSDKKTIEVSTMNAPVYAMSGPTDPNNLTGIPNECLVYIQTLTQS